MQAGLA